MGVCSAERRTCCTCQGRRSVAVPRDNSRYDLLSPRLGGQPAPKKRDFLQIFRGEFKTPPSRLLIAPMEPADHEMYRAAIHGDLEAFELVIRKMSRPLFAIAFGALQTATKPTTWCRTHSSKVGKRAGRCAIQRNFRPGSPRLCAIAPTTS